MKVFYEEGLCFVDMENVITEEEVDVFFIE